MQVNEMRARVRLIRRYMDRRQSVLECLREVALAKPDGIDLTSFSYRREESVKLNAQAVRSPMIFQFKRMLDDSDVFAEVKLGDQVRDRSGKERFDMELTLGGKSP